MYYEHDGLVRERYVMKQRPTGILMTKILWWACLFEYLSTSISQELSCRNLKNFLFMLSMAATRSSGGIVICYVLAILWMMSCLHIMARNKWWEERILFTKANIQYQYHKTITSGRLPEGAKRTFNQWLTGGSTNCLVCCIVLRMMWRMCCMAVTCWDTGKCAAQWTSRWWAAISDCTAHRMLAQAPTKRSSIDIDWRPAKTSW